MIHKKMAARGSSGGTLAYVYRGDGHEHEVEHVYHIASQCISDDPIERDDEGNIKDIDISDMEAELDHLGSKNNRSDLKFAHYVISLPPGESLNKEQWKDVVHTYMQAMGYDKTTKWTCALHAEKEHQHVHIVACRVRNDPRTQAPDGSKIKAYNLVSDSNDYAVGMKVMRDMEIKYGLSRTPDPSDTWGRDEHRADFEKMVNDAEAGRPTKAPWKSRILGRLHAAVEQSKGKSFTHFLEACRRKGVEPMVTVNDKGYPIGISYSMDGRSESGAKLKGTRLTFSALTGQKYDSATESMQPTGKKSEGITYAQERDIKACLETRQSPRSIESFRKSEEARSSHPHQKASSEERSGVEHKHEAATSSVDWSDLDGPMTIHNMASWKGKIDQAASEEKSRLDKQLEDLEARMRESRRALFDWIMTPSPKTLEQILGEAKKKALEDDFDIRPK
ncbi:hypothetical protein MSNKSG1_00763 [Marinobacter santoriniensis NKSG1]|uniref:MobA/VirD2-like nuclease domain-containing protein n=1 Tax=Marinobacter santoriniensis NKSG1 TaxID=1288826 RepID=M7CVF0_9GAMM|nr:relaxase/mobilization nuclease domain-containing protein [Marinobacter santoriniensis]EMP57109.1 hypothetical protein MSNKSG1_00763 [Marinobacter santoriniensis NKSG1]